MLGSVKDLPLTMDWKRAGVVTQVKEQVELNNKAMHVAFLYISILIV